MGSEHRPVISAWALNRGIFARETSHCSVGELSNSSWPPAPVVGQNAVWFKVTRYQSFICLPPKSPNRAAGPYAQMSKQSGQGIFCSVKCLFIALNESLLHLSLEQETDRESYLDVIWRADSLELCSYWDSASCTATQELPNTSWNPKVYYRV
jgi:hypothetical protein